LLEYETLTGDELKELMAGRPIIRKIDEDDSKGPAGPAVPNAGRARPPREEPGAGSAEPQPA
jgi:cell division protease FtsH